MKEVKRICQQMQQAFTGKAWHGPSLMEILEGVDSAIAAAKPIPGERGKVAKFPDKHLKEPLVANGSSAYDNFHGHLQHNLYHAGQVILLKKMATAT